MKLLSQAIAEGFVPGRDCCTHCGETQSLLYVSGPLGGEHYCQHHYEQIKAWVERVLSDE